MQFSFCCKPYWHFAAEKLPRVYGATLPSSFALYVFNPDLLAAVERPSSGVAAKKYIPEKYQQLPVLGGWYGKGMIPDRENPVEKPPGCCIPSDRRQSAKRRYRHRIRTDENSANHHAQRDNGRQHRRRSAISAKLSVQEKRGNTLADYGQKKKSLDEVARMFKGLPKNRRVRVYMAQDADGLATACDQSTRSKAIWLAVRQTLSISVLMKCANPSHGFPLNKS